MKANVRRAGVLTLLGLFLLVPGLKAAGQCADYITSGGRDAPLTGELVGEYMVTVTSTMTLSSGLTAKLFSGSYSISRARVTTHWVGTYRMSDGTTRQVACDTYRFV
jgi:hypothetical protein